MCRAEMNIEKWFIRSRARAVPRREFISSRSELIRDRRKCLQSREKERERERERERGIARLPACVLGHFAVHAVLLSGLRSSEGGHFPRWHPATDVRGLKPVFFSDLLQQLRPPLPSVTFRLCLVCLYDARSSTQLAWTFIHSRSASQIRYSIGRLSRASLPTSSRLA